MTFLLEQTEVELKIPFQFYHTHHWPDAPEDIKFLREVHEHRFEVVVIVSVKHPDRAVEFFQFRRFCRCTVLPKLLAIWEPRFSCEMIGAKIYELIMALYPDEITVYSVEVSEDGEFSAIVYPQGK